MAAKVEGGIHKEMWLLLPEAEHICIVGRDTKDGPEHPRYDPRSKSEFPFDDKDRALVEELKQSRRLLQSIRVAKVKYRDKSGELRERLEVVVGRRRVMAARYVNAWLRKQGVTDPNDLVWVPLLIDRSDSLDHMISQIVENEHRKDDTVLNRARKAARLLSMGCDVKRVAVTFGKSVHTVQGWVRLASASPLLLKLVEDGVVDSTVALKIAALPMDEHIAAWETMRDEAAKAGVRVTVNFAVRSLQRNFASKIEQPEALEEGLDTSEDGSEPSASPVASGGPGSAPEAASEPTPAKKKAKAASEAPERKKEREEDDDPSPVVAPPSKHLLNWLCKASDAGSIEVDAELLALVRCLDSSEKAPRAGDSKLLGSRVYRALRYLAGASDGKQIGGLTEALRLREDGKKKGGAHVEIPAAKRGAA
jgi:ParB-like chromosome segregation protein Spo0J